MNRRIAKKINDRTAKCVATHQPVPYTRGQVRRALHRLRRTWGSARPAKLWAYSVGHAKGPGGWVVVAHTLPSGRRAFPWEGRDFQRPDLSPAIEACGRLADSLERLGNAANAALGAL